MNNILAIDIGGTSISLFVLSENYKQVETREISSSEVNSTEDLSDFISESINSVSAIGISCAGSVNSEMGIVYFSPNISWLRNCRIKENFENKFKVPVEIENDANCFILGEAMFGAYKNPKRIIGYTLGSGIGGGVFIDGKLLRGFGSAELGHVTIDFNGLQCNCGRRGCLEAYCGGIWVDRFIENNRELKNHANRPLKSVDSLELFNLARDKDDFALNFWQEWGKFLGIGIVQTINILRPESVVLGGKIAIAYDFFHNDMLNTIRKLVFPPFNPNMKIYKSNFNNSGIMGAAYLANNMQNNVQNI